MRYASCVGEACSTEIKGVSEEHLGGALGQQRADVRSDHVRCDVSV
jgi:hypothetical protein